MASRVFYSFARPVGVFTYFHSPVKVSLSSPHFLNGPICPSLCSACSHLFSRGYSSIAAPANRTIHFHLLSLSEQRRGNFAASPSLVHLNFRPLLFSLQKNNTDKCVLISYVYTKLHTYCLVLLYLCLTPNPQYLFFGCSTCWEFDWVFQFFEFALSHLSPSLSVSFPFPPMSLYFRWQPYRARSMGIRWIFTPFVRR